MGSRSSSTRRRAGESKEEKLDYQELVKKLSELNIIIRVTKGDYSRAGKSVKALIKLLLNRLEAVERGGLKIGEELTEEEIEYVIYRLRTIYGDPMAASVASKLSNLLKKHREKESTSESAS